MQSACKLHYRCPHQNAFKSLKCAKHSFSGCPNCVVVSLLQDAIEHRKHFESFRLVLFLGADHILEIFVVTVGLFHLNCLTLAELIVDMHNPRCNPFLGCSAEELVSEAVLCRFELLNVRCTGSELSSGGTACYMGELLAALVELHAQLKVLIDMHGFFMEASLKMRISVCAVCRLVQGVGQKRLDHCQKIVGFDVSPVALQWCALDKAFLQSPQLVGILR